MKTLVTISSLAVVASNGLADERSDCLALLNVTTANFPVVIASRDGFGAVNVESSIDIKDVGADAIVDIGSITKTITAIAVLHLVEKQGLTFNANLGDLLPNVPPDKANITLHQLLTNSSGIIESTGDDHELLSRAEFLERVLASPLGFVPGTAYSYSNAGYSLLAAIIEVQSGLKYEDYLIDQLIPKGLPAIGYTRAYETDRAIMSNRLLLTGFSRQTVAEASWGALEPKWNLIGNGGLVTTAEGFLSFWAAFLDGKIVDKTLVTKAITPHLDEGNGNTFYGYGIVIQPLADGTNLYWHDGGNEIFSAEWRHFSGSNITLFAAGRGNAAFDAMAVILDCAQD